MRTRTIRGRVAIVGIGETRYYKHGQSPEPEFALALRAIYSWERAWHPVHPALRGHGPYVVVLVELPHAGHVRMIGNLVGDPGQTVEIGATIEAGIGWVPWLLDAMDEAYLKHHFWVRPKLDKLTWPHSAEAIERTMGHLSDASRAKVLGLNAARFFGFRVP